MLVWSGEVEGEWDNKQKRGKKCKWSSLSEKRRIGLRERGRKREGEGGIVKERQVVEKR